MNKPFAGAVDAERMEELLTAVVRDVIRQLRPRCPMDIVASGDEIDDAYAAARKHLEELMQVD
jgi:hypothetical protein